MKTNTLLLLVTATLAAVCFSTASAADKTKAAPPNVGEPVNLKFRALKGSVDLAELKGKVVLIDFWATWCPPCVAEVPNVVATYNKLHDKGFEIVGISLDQDKGRLTSFIKEHKMPWPQHFDGKGWDNEISRGFGIKSVPTMWLVDKEGNLATTSARSNLEKQVEALLAK